MEIPNGFQANIVKASGRNHTAYIFLHFRFYGNALLDTHNAKYVRNWLIKMGKKYVTSHNKQCKDSSHYKIDNSRQRFVCSLSLSFTGYKKAGILSAYIPKDLAFRDGMMHTDRLINLFGGYRWTIEKDLSNIDALITISHDDQLILKEKVDRIVNKNSFLKAITYYSVQYGFQARSKDNPDQIIGPLNFADGNSQSKDIAQNWKSTAANEIWPYENEECSYGSYLAILKLQVHSNIFSELTKEIVNRYKVSEEFAAALFIGRFRNGTPLVTYSEPQMPEVWSKDGVDYPFDYKDDKNGAKCPIKAHVRAANPRNSKKFLPIVRRSTSYSEKNKTTIRELSNNISGLFFVSYQRDIDHQFEFLLKNITNKNARDILIYPNAPGSNNLKRITAYHTFEKDPTLGKEINVEVPDLISFLGGEYLFAPSISFLKKLNTFPIKIHNDIKE